MKVKWRNSQVIERGKLSECINIISGSKNSIPDFKIYFYFKYDELIKING